MDVSAARDKTGWLPVDATRWAKTQHTNITTAALSHRVFRSAHRSAIERYQLPNTRALFA